MCKNYRLFKNKCLKFNRKIDILTAFWIFTTWSGFLISWQEPFNFSMNVFCKHKINLYLFERHNNRENIFRFISQNAATSGWSWSYIWISWDISRGGRGTWAAFPGALVWSRIRSGASGSWTGTLMWDARDAGSGLTWWWKCQPLVGYL